MDACDTPFMDWVDVSHEMISMVGLGRVPELAWPENSVALLFGFGGVEEPATLRYLADPTYEALDWDDSRGRLIFIVSQEACERLCGGAVVMEDGAYYHLNADLRTIAMAIRDCTLPEAVRTPYRLAKSIELLCETLRLPEADALIPISLDGKLSRADSKRILAARRMIDEQWAEKLTLDRIARACGLNRAKLTRGFREMFDCSVADAIANCRLVRAGDMLLSTDLPVSSVGYQCGYLNNASFARAFARHFGLAPTQFRAVRLAA